MCNDCATHPCGYPNSQLDNTRFVVVQFIMRPRTDVRCQKKSARTFSAIKIVLYIRSIDVGDQFQHGRNSSINLIEDYSGVQILNTL